MVHRKDNEMLTQEETKRLQEHVIGIFQSLILPQINPEGYILYLEMDGELIADPVTTHHLGELCLELDSSSMQRIINNATDWVSKSSLLLKDPFAMTSLAHARKISKEDAKNIITTGILPAQHPSGFIDLYAGFLDGGSIFSTLWAIKILLLLSEIAEYDVRLPVQKAFAAIENHWEDVHRTSFKGFYCELIWTFQKQIKDERKVNQALIEILDAQAENGFWDKNALYTAYIMGNLAACPEKFKPKVMKALDLAFKNYFNLDEKAESLPPVLARPKEPFSESGYIQICMRAIISAIRYLRAFYSQDSLSNIVSSVIGNVPVIYYAVKKFDSELKKYIQQFGEIRKKFTHLEDKAKGILQISPYEKNVFIMMPYVQEKDERYEDIEQVIKSVLKKEGFRAWLASDMTLSPNLWDNVVCFMLGCKYGISIFARIERDYQIETDEFNPNVSLELGFMLSRGKEVLILKDCALPKLPTDLLGYLYTEFDLNQVKRQLPRKIRKWIKETNEKKE